MTLLAADLVLILHFAFVTWVVLGGFAALRWPWLVWVHLPAASWGVLIELSGGVCPLTPLEAALRRRAGVRDHDGGFIEQYLTAWLYPDGLTRDHQIALGLVLLLVNVAVYWRIAKRHCNATASGK